LLPEKPAAASGARGSDDDRGEEPRTQP